MVAASVTGRRKQAARKFMAMLSAVAVAVVVAGLTVGVAGPAQATTAIGDVGPGGGIVFITPTTAGNSTGKFFEAAPNTWDGSAPDGKARWCQISTANIPGLGTAIGTGVTNSATIDATCTSTGTGNAAEYVRAKTIGGFSDWFLPSRDEMLGDSILELRGLTPAEAMAQSADQIHPMESLSISLSYFEQFNKWLLAGETPEAFHAELDYFHEDGHLIRCEVMAIPIFGDDGSVIELRGVSAPLLTDL
jgi:hypothetical protein